MRKLLSLFLAAAIVCLSVTAFAAETAPKPLHFKVDHGVQKTVFGEMHQYEGVWAVSVKDPVYPPKELKARIIGTVTMDVLVAEDGSVADVRVKKSSGNANLDAAALEAIRHWKYPMLTPPARYANVEMWEFMLDG